MNRLLEQQFISGYGKARYFPRVSKNFELTNSRKVTLENIILGQPLVSFESASLADSKATVTFGVVGGAYSEVMTVPGEPDVLLTRSKIKETHGFTITATVDLAVTRGDIDRVGRVTLDLFGAVDFSCNFGSLTSIRTEVNKLFSAYFKALPVHKRIFQLGVLDLSGYNALTPVKFYLRTQQAPGADVIGAENEGDGAVLVFIDLAGSTPGKDFPPAGGSFPYFIPDDKLNGQDQYSAALVLHHSMLAEANEDNMALLTTLLFPGQNHFKPLSTHDPYDRIVFGDLAPSITLYSVEPTFSTIQAGGKQSFLFTDGDGNTVNATWKARSLNSFGTVGAGSMVGNVYTADPVSSIGHDTLRVVVTGTYEKDGNKYEASALLLVACEAVSISPLVSERQVFAQASDFLPGAAKSSTPKHWINAEPIQFTASAADTDEVEWTLLGDAYGDIEPTGKAAVYTLPDPLEIAGKPLFVQHVRAYNKTTQQEMVTSVLLSSWVHTAHIEPAFVGNLEPNAEVQLTTDWKLPGTVTWSVINGDGTVDQDGKFVASNSSEPQTNIVLYNYLSDSGEVGVTGYSVIETSGYTPQKSWDTVRITLKVQDGQDPTDSEFEGRAYANGWQQVRLRATLQTVGGELSAEEKDSLEVMDYDSKQPVVNTDQFNEFGIPYGSDFDWGFAKQSNSFTMFGASKINDNEPNALDDQDLYVVGRPLTDEEVKTRLFFVRFFDSNNTPHSSLVADNPEEGIVFIKPIPLPTLNEASYVFTHERALTEGDVVVDPSADKDEPPSYDYNYRTIDYYTVAYREAQFKFVNFERTDTTLTLKDINRSTIQWESNVLEETMFSYTGSAFIPLSGAEPKYLEFDPDLVSMNPKLTSKLTALAIDTAYRPSAGELLVSLHRTDDVEYVPRSNPVRKKLDKGVNFEFQDVYGNFHGITISFPDASNENSRNQLMLGTFLRDHESGEVIES
ncbi:hypothetical protein ACIQYF_07795 [Pseudomonas sp. NPDC096917]|uniref:hypothetical protein n=1 Tax=Pseudomonas sp. NPDC096917 TaxID=3364483 RepID=UPI00383A2924